MRGCGLCSRVGRIDFFLMFCLSWRAGSRPGRLTFFCNAQKKVSKEKASRIRCPCASLRVRCVARIARGAHKLVCFAAFGHVRPLSGRSCATRQRMTAGEPSPQPSPRGRGGKTRTPEGESEPEPVCGRVAGLSSAGARGSDVRMSEGRAADKFADIPRDTSSARKPAGPRTSARLFFGYFLLAKQKKVARPPGRDPACHDNKPATSSTRVRSESPASSAAWPPPQPTTATSLPCPPSPPMSPGTCESSCSSRSAPRAAPSRA